MISVHIMHNQKLVQQGLFQILHNVSGIRVDGKSKNTDELFELCEELRVDVIILVLNFEDLLGFEYAELKAKTKAKILVMACLDPEESVVNALHPGADGYILASDPVDELMLGISRLANGMPFLASSIGFALLTPEKWRQLRSDRVVLTDREMEILTLIGEGLTNQEIANRLFTSKRTVEGHRYNLLQKTGTKNSAALIKFAMSSHIILTDD